MELFKIADGRTCFYQWDLDQKILVNDIAINEVHFCNGTSDCSLVVRVEDGAADVPNILLQIARSIRVYAVQDDHTCAESVFAVRQRTKPADYVYTETEVKRYEDLEKQIEEVRKSIPSVPVQSVNGKTGEVQLTPSDVGALPSDTPIPDAYTLPTASAEVKGGVKVGNGLKMRGEVLEVASASGGGVTIEDDPINIVTVAEEGVTRVDITTDSNGNELDLLAVVVEIETPADSAKNGIVWLYDGDLNQIGGAFITSMISATANTSRMFSVPLSGKRLTLGLGSSTSASSIGALSTYVHSNMFYNADIPIKMIRVLCANGFAADTVITVWGARA